MEKRVKGGGVMRRKRLICILMSFVLVLSSWVMFDLDVKAISQNEVVSQLNSLVNQYNGKTANSNQMYMGSQCKGFANWVFLKIFGVYIGPYPESANYKISNPNAQTVGIIEPGNLNEASAKELLQKGVPGDYIQVQRSTARGRGPHSMILAGVNENGIEVFDCNSDGRNTIKKYGISWAAFDTANRAMSLYHAHNYSVSTSEPTNPSIPQGDLLNLGNSFSARIRHCSSGKVVTNSNYNAVIGTSMNEKIARQIWKFTRNSNGSYRIQSCLNMDYCLELHNFSDFEGGDVRCAPMNGSTAQNWFIYKEADGIVYMRPECSNTRVLDLTDGETSDGTNLQIWSHGDTQNQRFAIDICAEVINLGDDFSGFIMNSQHWKPIMQDDTDNVILGVENTKNMARELWHFVRNPQNGYYTIESYFNGKVLTVEGGRDQEGTNVICSEKNGSTSQQWFVLMRPDGSCYFKAGCSALNLDLFNGSDAEGTNIQMWSINNTPAQTFSIYGLDGERDRMGYTLISEKSSIDIGEKTELTVSNALYAVDYKLNIVPPDGKIKTVHLGTKNTYEFIPDAKGIYKIYASVKSPVASYSGSESENYILLAVGYGFEAPLELSKVYQGHLYQLVKKQNVNWAQARDYCDSKNSYLAAITDREENQEVAELVNKYGRDVFIGGVRKDEKDFRWVVASNEQFFYSNWGQGEPNNIYHDNCPLRDPYGVYGRENYIGMTQDGIWNDYPIIDSHVNAFVMESVISSIQVSSSGKITYKEGEQFDKNGILVEGIFSDGSRRQIEDYEIHGFDSSKTGTQKVTVSYGGASQAVFVNVEHNYTLRDTTSPTCTSPGIKTYVCPACGDAYTERVKASGHNYKETVIKPTEQEQGYTLHECTVCGDTYKSDYTDRKEHHYEAVEIKEASCTEGGYKIFRCTDCNAEYTMEIPAAGHSFETQIVSPTCEEKGYSHHVCSVCGESYDDAYTDEKGHDYISKVIKEATCGEEGAAAYTCQACGQEETSIIAMLEHQYQETVKKQQTCTDTGIKEYICGFCGDTHTEIIPANGHSYTETVIEPTLTDQGYTIHTCTVCGDNYKDQYTGPAGSSHTPVIDVAVEPSCTQDGKTEGVHCSTCNEVIEEQKIIPALGHDYRQELIPAAMGQDGSIGQKCSRCGETDEEAETILAPKTIKLSKTFRTYNGKSQKPSVAVKDRIGKALSKKADFTVSYPKNMKNVGKYTIRVEFQGNYSGMEERDFTIIPKGTNITKAVPKKKGVALKWNKQKEQVTGYEIVYSTDKKFRKDVRLKTIGSAKTSTYSFTKLKPGKKYYVKICTYKKVNVEGKATKIYSEWSKVKTFVVK